MATIEPRLIHLLNGSTTPQLPHADLPALNTLPRPTSSERSLPPLELDQGQRFDKSRLDDPVGPHGYSLGVDDVTSAQHHLDGHLQPAGTNLTYPLRPLWGDSEGFEQSGALPGARDDGHDLSDDSSLKRSRALHVKEDFMQLPQPVKKPKAAQQTLVMPPIINGLHEPPPYAAMFPPISSSSFAGATSGSSQQRLHDFSHTHERRASKQSSPEADKFVVSRVRKRAVKPRRKWTEEETKHLLLGVNRHGVGKWTCILEDPEFRFNDRTAGDLKDRFRTCCPDELRTNKGSHPDSPPMPSNSVHKAKTGIMSENILIEDDGSHSDEVAHHEAAPSKQKKSRAHRKKMTDLAELGIHGPFKKSHRRERRPFTDNDDREILDGLDIYGPAWTKIQRDTRFNFSCRQPTDLRDRVRNKYPELYQRIEKGTFLPREDHARGNDVLEPYVTMSIDNSLQRSKVAALEPQMTGPTLRDDLPRWSLQA